MIGLKAPTVETLRAWSAAQAAEPFNYPDVGATRRVDEPGFAPPRGFRLDRLQTRLGEGDDCFAAAADAIFAGRMFPGGWLVAAMPTPPLVAGAVIAISARSGGLWWANAARVVYVIDEHDATGRRRGFAYGTLPSHVERGEERFAVEHRPDGSVWYDLAAFSRPWHPLVWATYPLARRLQAKFRRHSAAAMQAAVAHVAAAEKAGTP